MNVALRRAALLYQPPSRVTIQQETLIRPFPKSTNGTVAMRTWNWEARFLQHGFISFMNRAALTALRDFLNDSIQDAVHVFVDIGVHETQKLNPICFDVFLSFTVVNINARSKMAFAVDLNRKLERRTVEINDILVNAILATKLKTQKLLPREIFPQQDLSSWHGFAKRSSPFRIRFSVEDLRHALSSTSPCSPPYKGGDWGGLI
jgi:hypothetical protein